VSVVPGSDCSQALLNGIFTPKLFGSNWELLGAVNKCMRYKVGDADQLATTYGWPIGRCDVSNVDDFSGIFAGKTFFNENIGHSNISFISSWDTSSVEDMCFMFLDAILLNQDVSSWDTFIVKDMSLMFFCAKAFNFASWKTSSAVRDMNSVF
jgi:hypothetical protein